MINKIILIMGWGLFGVGVYFARKQRFFRQIFETIQKCQKYHLDYVDDIAHLPVNKKVLLVGPTASDNPSDEFIAKTYIKKQNQANRFWSFRLRNQFSMVNPNIQKVRIEADTQVDNFAFNWEKTAEKGQIEERSIRNGSLMCCYGKLERRGDARTLKAQIIMGSQHESLLTHFDRQIIKFNQKQKKFTIVGTVLLLSHFSYHYFIEKQSQSRKIMAEIDSEA